MLTSGGLGVRIGVLGPVVAWRDGVEVDLRGPVHRAVLARLVVAGGRSVTVDALVDDLWTVPPAGAVAAVRTFVAALRRALEPDRPPRAPSSVLVTVGSGYALRTPPGGIDVEEFTAALTSQVTGDLERALGLWRGPALDGLGEQPWADGVRNRWVDDRLRAVELLAAARLREGVEAVADLQTHVAEHPWREEGWRLLATALAAGGRRAEALQVLRTARSVLVDELGLDPGPGLRQTEAELLATPTAGRWPSAVDALTHLAVSGGEGLQAARRGRSATLDAVAGLEARAAARVVAGFGVPALWSRADDPDQAARIVSLTEELLTGEVPDVTRARLLATLAIERRGVGGASTAAHEAELLARALGNPEVLVRALNARFLASFEHPGGTELRRGIGTELVEVSYRQELAPFEILGHLVLLQTACATGDLAAAEQHRARAAELGDLEDTPLVGVFSKGFDVLRSAMTGAPVPVVVEGYRAVAQELASSGMPGLSDGFLPLAVAAAHVQHDRPVPAECAAGPWRPWTEPLVQLGAGDRAGARETLDRVPGTPPGHLAVLLDCLLAVAAADLGDRDLAAELLFRLEPVQGEFAGAGTGLVTAGPVAGFTARLGGLR